MSKLSFWFLWFCGSKDLLKHHLDLITVLKERIKPVSKMKNRQTKTKTQKANNKNTKKINCFMNMDIARTWLRKPLRLFFLITFSKTPNWISELYQSTLSYKFRMVLNGMLCLSWNISPKCRFSVVALKWPRLYWIHHWSEMRSLVKKWWSVIGT